MQLIHNNIQSRSLGYSSTIWLNRHIKVYSRACLSALNVVYPREGKSHQTTELTWEVYWQEGRGCRGGSPWVREKEQGWEALAMYEGIQRMRTGRALWSSCSSWWSILSGPWELSSVNAWILTGTWAQRVLLVAAVNDVFWELAWMLSLRLTVLMGKLEDGSLKTCASLVIWTLKIWQWLEILKDAEFWNHKAYGKFRTFPCHKRKVSWWKEASGRVEALLE